MTTSYESIAKLAQEYSRERPVVVLGCGAVVPYGLPSMSELAQGLVDRIDSDEERWNDFKKALNRLQDLERALQEVELPDRVHQRVIEETWRIIAEKDLAVFERLLADPNCLALARLLRHLLRVANPHVAVVTTNYDRLAEYAANVAEAYAFTGFTAGWMQRFISNASTTTGIPRNSGFQGRVDIWKVHGSLDWFQDPSQSPISIPFARSIPNNCQPLIVTPGVAKYRDVLVKDPFRTVMAQADAALKSAGGYLCIGYGFNDEHVQPILVDRVCRARIPIVLITKALTEAARSTLLRGKSAKYLLIEEDAAGTKAYFPSSPDGDILAGSNLWMLSDFLDMLLGEGNT